MYELNYDADQEMVKVVKRGFWSMAVFEQFETDVLKLRDHAPSRKRPFRVVADCRDYAVQSGEILDAYARLFETLTGKDDWQFAILASTKLNKLQAKRAMPQDNVQVFETEKDAMSWLFQNERSPA